VSVSDTVTTLGRTWHVSGTWYVHGDM